MIYRIRVILDNDVETVVFRDLEIRNDDTLEDLHNIIMQSFGFDARELASFYISNAQWEQGEEISLFDLSDDQSARLMNETVINTVLDKRHTKLIYVYDFLAMWIFYVELVEVVKEVQGLGYPNLVFAQGQLPEHAPEKSFEAETEDSDPADSLFDDFSTGDYDHLDFDEYDYP